MVIWIKQISLYQEIKAGYYTHFFLKKRSLKSLNNAMLDPKSLTYVALVSCTTELIVLCTETRTCPYVSW